ncbi:MAG: glycoside hydrolase family 2 protein [Rikenellaceae bacterium]|nr:glycoside hydrolase family 2 protein [Rikenellaceae bacterium]
MKRGVLLLAVVVLPFMLLAQNFRKEVILTDGWRFSHESDAMKAQGDAIAAERYNDLSWEVVRVPHDWAIKGPFDESIDKQYKPVIEDGATVPTWRTGRTGALPFIGAGWYRTKFTVPQACERAIINFDGAMAEPVVYVNGRKAGEWKLGYASFNVDVTPYIYRDGRENTLAVRLEMRPFCSRWYPGAGLFRHVTLITTPTTAIDCWGLNMNTISVSDTGDVAASFEAKVTGYAGKKLIVCWKVAGKDFEQSVDGQGVAVATQSFSDVTPWSPEEPKLYDMQVDLHSVAPDGSRRIIDSKIVKIGFRTVKITPERGFELNGKVRKIKGVCLHHDLGMLGAAANKAAMRRQLELLKSMGCDGIRTSHNIPSQWQMDLCDELGFLVMAESFDEWRIPKVENGYNRFFDAWYKRDLKNLVDANKLHPSIVMWSVGNEVRELWKPGNEKSAGATIARMLVGELHRLDPSRPVTAGINRSLLAIELGAAQVFDIMGVNYHLYQYDEIYAKSGHGNILGSETASTVSSRGVYHFPVIALVAQSDTDKKTRGAVEKNILHRDYQNSSYDTEVVPWGNLPDYDWAQQEDKPWVIGEFVWTGFDYLGEPSPYNNVWPSRSSYFGIIDLAGLPKDRYYLYRSHWNTAQPTIHLLPHWNWEGREGMVTPVYCYTNYPTAELFINGKSQGKRTKTKNGDILDRFRLRWNDVVYEPGEVKVVVFDENGLKVGEKSVKTAGRPHHIELCADRGTGKEVRKYSEMRADKCNPSQFSLGGYLKADGDDMAFVTVRVVDKDGNLCPTASHQLTMKVTGNGAFKGVCNGDPTSLEVFVKPTMKLFNGELVVGVQTTKQAGEMVLKVSGKGVGAATITLKSK